MLGVIARTPAVSLCTNLILPTPAGRILLMPRNHENQVWDVPGVHLRRRAHPRVRNHVPDKFPIFTPSHAADPVSGQLASLARFKSFGRSPFFSNVCEKKQAQLIQMGSRRARIGTVRWRAADVPRRGNHLRSESASAWKVSKL